MNNRRPSRVAGVEDDAVGVGGPGVEGPYGQPYPTSSQGQSSASNAPSRTAGLRRPSGLATGLKLSHHSLAIVEDEDDKKSGSRHGRSDSKAKFLGLPRPFRARLLRLLHVRPRRSTVLIMVNLAVLALLLYRSFDTPLPILRIPEKATAADGTAGTAAEVAQVARSRKAFSSQATSGTGSCEFCITSPTDPICRPYGIDNVRLSRSYLGSGHRVRKVLERALRGEPITIGIIGASVSAGHGLIPPHETVWHKQFLQDFVKMFPKTILYDGVAPGTGSGFYSFCFDALISKDLDIYLVELDINNDAIDSTYKDDDALFRGLLSLPQKPAVIRASVFALEFRDLARGTPSALIMSEYFDVPVIGIRNFLLPHTILHPELMDKYFARMGPNRDIVDKRHISWLGHQAMGDMLAIYFRDQVCETKRRLAHPPPLPDSTSDFPSSDILGAVPPQYLWTNYQPNAEIVPLTPSCQLTGSTLSPLIPLSKNGAWKTEEWNGKRAITSYEVGASILFNFTGTRIGIFVWTTDGTKNTQKPGRASCWVDEDNARATIVDAWTSIPFSSSEWNLVAQDLEPGSHTLTCELIEESSSGGHDFRILGVGSQ